MQMELDEIIYTAITANATLVSLTDGRIKSTTFEVPPTKEDNTQLPYIVIYEDQSQNDQGTKDNVWESNRDTVNVGVEIAATSPADVKRIRKLIRKAVMDYVFSNKTDIIELLSLAYDGIQWFWEKPCYYDTLHYSCEMQIDLNDEDDGQEISND